LCIEPPAVKYGSPGRPCFFHLTFVHIMITHHVLCSCNVFMQHVRATCSCSCVHVARASSMFMHHLRGMFLQHGYAASSWGIDMQHQYAAWTHSWACSWDMHVRAACPRVSLLYVYATLEMQDGNTWICLDMHGHPAWTVRTCMAMHHEHAYSMSMQNRHTWSCSMYCTCNM
jgi:hypothetical protein